MVKNIFEDVENVKEIYFKDFVSGIETAQTLYNYRGVISIILLLICSFLCLCYIVGIDIRFFGK